MGSVAEPLAWCRGRAPCVGSGGKASLKLKACLHLYNLISCSICPKICFCRTKTWPLGPLDPPMSPMPYRKRHRVTRSHAHSIPGAVNGQKLSVVNFDWFIEFSCIFELGPSSMKNYCLDEIKKGRYTFVCPDPKCKRIWEYFLVRHVACLDDKTRSTVEKTVTVNYISQERGFQQCPGCQTWCIPVNKGKIRLQCDICSRDLGRRYEFCWACLHQWKGSSITCCGNEGCDGKDPRIRILSVAKKKSIDEIPGCPSIRACPKCGLLINHEKGCRHMTCTSCKAQFCFICLKRWSTHPQHLGGLALTKCAVAPAQAQLSDPSWEDRNDDDFVQPAPAPSPANDSYCVIL